MPLLARQTLAGIRACDDPMRASRRGGIVKKLDNIGEYAITSQPSLICILISLSESGCRWAFARSEGGAEERMRGWLRYIGRRKMCYQTFLCKVEALRGAGFALSLDPSGAIRFFAPTGEEH